MFRTLLLLAPLALCACATTTTGAVTDAQAALTDGQAILAALEASGKVSTKVTNDASAVIAGLQAVLNAYGNAASASIEQQALASAKAAVQQVLADTSDAKVSEAGALALAAIAAAETISTAGVTTQAEAAIGAVLLDDLASAQPGQIVAAR